MCNVHVVPVLSLNYNDTCNCIDKCENKIDIHDSSDDNEEDEIGNGKLAWFRETAKKQY